MKKRETMKEKCVSKVRKTQIKILKKINAMKREISEI